LQFSAGKLQFGVGEEVFVGKVGAEEGGVVRVEGDEEAGVKIGPQRVNGEAGADAGADVGGGVELESCAPRFQVSKEILVLNGGEDVAEAFRADGEGLANSFGSGGFAGVVGEAEAGIARAGVHLAEGLGAAAAFVATEADADDGRVIATKLGGFAEDFFGFVEREVAHGIEDPVESEADFLLGAKAGAFEAGEDGVEAVGVGIAPVVDDTDGDVDLGVDDALLGEMLCHAPRSEIIVVGGE